MKNLVFSGEWKVAEERPNRGEVKLTDKIHVGG